MSHYRNENNVNYILNNHLQSSERLLWSGSPELGIVFSKQDRVLVPFSIFWLGFALFWEYMAISMDAPFIMPIFGSFFVLIGIYIFIGRFFHDAVRRKNTFYGLTNNRVIILKGIFSKTLISKNYDHISDVTIEEKQDKSGTIYFDKPSLKNAKRVSFGSINTPVSFERIPEALTIYNLINEHTRKTHSKT